MARALLHSLLECLYARRAAMGFAYGLGVAGSFLWAPFMPVAVMVLARIAMMVAVTIIIVASHRAAVCPTRAPALPDLLLLGG